MNSNVIVIGQFQKTASKNHEIALQLQGYGIIIYPDQAKFIGQVSPGGEQGIVLYPDGSARKMKYADFQKENDVFELVAEEESHYIKEKGLDVSLSRYSGYMGEWYCGCKHGVGFEYKKIDNTECFYLGEFKNDKPEGKGIFMSANGTAIYADFNSNEFNTWAVLIDKNIFLKGSEINED